MIPYIMVKGFGFLGIISSLSWIIVELLLCGFIKPAAAFVALTKPQTQLLSLRLYSNPCSTHRCRYGESRIAHGEAYGRRWSTASKAEAQSRRSRRRSAGSRNGSSSLGVGSLKAGMGFPPMMPGDIAEFVGRELQEQSVRHHWQSGFIGGSVGVLGTLSAIQLKINEVKELTSCPYCRSTGQLPCATCFSSGSVAIKDTVGDSTQITTTTLTCPCCRGKTYITCVNCKGDGRAVPLFLNKKVSRDPESEIEDVGYA